jgi:NADPH-dependent 2,4-dienoyl-CoA reductase/sulfur reductase-like enzyme
MFLEGLAVHCTLNTTVGREKEMALVATQKPKKVLVAGGGPGGLEAARVAALRGHQVTLCEKADKLGGQFNLAAVPPTKQEFAKAIQYLSTQVRKAGVKVELGKEVTPKLVDKLKPDVVIVATGGAPVIPADIPGIDKPIVVTAHDVLWGKAVVGDRVVIVGGGEVGCETADYAGERGARQITVIEMLEDVALDMIPWSKEFLMERLKGYGVSILTSAKVKEILDDGVVFTRNGKEESIRGVSSVILAMGAKSVDDISKAVKGKAAEVHVIGDAKEPRKAFEAIHEGADIARKI